MQYKVIFIDWDGTLSRSRFWDRWNDGLEHQWKYDLLQSTLFISDMGRDLVKKWMLGDRSYSDIIDYAANVTGIPTEELETELRYSAENMKFIDRNALELIRRLRRHGLKVVIATDNMDIFRKWTVPAMRLEERFDDILTSDRRKAFKTHSTRERTSLFFDNYISKHGIKAHQSALIDDSLDTKIVEQWGIDFFHVTEIEPLAVHLRRLIEGIESATENAKFETEN